jgi:hypothetical protein
MAPIMPDIPFHSGEVISVWQLTLLVMVCICLAGVWIWSRYQLKKSSFNVDRLEHDYQRLFLAKDVRLHVIKFGEQSFLVFETAGQLVLLQQNITERPQ